MAAMTWSVIESCSVIYCEEVQMVEVSMMLFLEEK